MEKDLGKGAAALLGALALSLSAGAGHSLAASDASPELAAGSLDHQCQTVKVKKRVRRWVWVPQTRTVHGRRVVVSVHGKVVYVRVRVWRTKTVAQLACTPAAPVPVPASPPALLAFTPAPVAAIEPAAPSPQPPLNVLPPTISGASREGGVMSAATGVWRGIATSFTYQWMRCDLAGGGCAPIPAAVSSSYGLAEADVAHTMRVTVVAANAAGSSAATSTPSEPVSALPRPPVATLAPTIPGAPQEGRTLAHEDGAWTNEPTNETHQWLGCDGSGNSCQPIAGATGETYVPGSGDVGGRLRVQETASNAAGSSAPATSPPSGVVAAAEQPPTSTSLPAISGVAQEGRTLSASPGSWTGSPTAFAYEWLRCDPAGASCVPIGLATTSSYSVSEADVGNTLRVIVTASNAAGSSAPATSAASEVVVAAEHPPTNTSLPVISGAVQDGQTLSASTGGWTNNPTAFAYKWKRCSAAGTSCKAIAGANTASLSLGGEDVGGTLRVVVTASNAAGASAPATSAASEVVTAAEHAPVNTSLPTIGGVAQEGQTLTAGAGSWTNTPTGFAYEWLRCDSAGANCVAIASATNSSYTVAEADVGQTLRVTVTASNAAGPSAPATSAQSAVVTVPEQPPSNTSLPTIGGVAQEGQTLTGSTGGWTNNPTSFAYAWKRCSASGTSCKTIAGANTANLDLVEADVGSTLRVIVTASNAAGSSAPATSAASEVVVAAEHPPTNTSLPVISGVAQEGKALSASAGGWTGSPSAFAYEWLRCDSAGANCAAIVSATGASYDLVEADVGKTVRVVVTASNAAGSSAPATSAPSEVVTAAEQPPTNTSLPTVSGIAQEGQTLSASPGSWTGNPTTFAYEWTRCSASGTNCQPIAGANSVSLNLVEADVGSTLRVVVTASNPAGPSAPAMSAQTAVVAAAESVQHLEYVLLPGTVSVYDIDHQFEPVKTISLPQTKDAVRGVAVAPATHTMFVMHGGDGPINSSGNGSVLAYDLVSEKVLWDAKLSTGVDSGQVSPDGSKLYVPTGENTPSGTWNVLSTANGEVIGTIQGGSLAHNTVASSDGGYVYLGGRGYNFLDVYETATGKVKELGPLVGSVRPLTANGSNTLAFTTATGFDGFQISSVSTGKVLFTVSFGGFPSGFPFTTASHGISLAPDEKEVYVIDAVNKEVQIWDVSKVKEGVAPSQLGVVALEGLSGNESPCVYDCGRGGWLQLSRDGRYLFVGDSGEVIDTSTRKVITTLSTLAQTKNSIEVDWQGGVPIATSGRNGVGRVP